MVIKESTKTSLFEDEALIYKNLGRTFYYEEVWTSYVEINPFFYCLKGRLYKCQGRGYSRADTFG